MAELVQVENRPFVLRDSVLPGTAAISAGAESALFTRDSASDTFARTNMFEKNKLPAKYRMDIFGVSYSLSQSMIPAKVKALLDSRPELIIKISNREVIRFLLEDVVQSGQITLGGTTTADSAAVASLRQQHNLPYTPVGFASEDGKVKPIKLIGGQRIEGALRFNIAISGSTFAATDWVDVKLHGILYEPTGN